MPSRLERDSLISPRTHLLQTSCEEINVFARSISPLKLCYAATEYTFAHCSFATDFFFLFAEVAHIDRYGSTFSCAVADFVMGGQLKTAHR